MNAKNEALLKKVRSLMNMTIENGASENEAKLASEKVAKMLSEHNLSMTDVELAESEILQKNYDMNRKALHEVQYCVGAISTFTNTKSWVMRNRNSSEIVYFGHDTDVEVAFYMTDMIKNVMEAAWKAEFEKIKKNSVKSERPHGRKLRKSFLLGMCHSINRRLMEMAAEEKKNSQNVSSDGKSLVVVKNNLVEKSFRELGMRLRYASRNHSNVDGSSYNAGNEKGSKVSLSKGVTSSGGMRYLS